MILNNRNKKVIILTLFITLFIILNPSISSIQYNQIENSIKENSKILLDNELIIQILKLINKILETIFVIPLILVEEIIDILWELNENIDNEIIKTISKIYILTIEILWYIAMGFCFPIFILIYFIDTIIDKLEPNKSSII